ncbi:hypothetical protein POVWA2_033490 [Plasmodium ovale wallikeri]|uniref:Uncharacterized protein n=1 Tax=Plasmodium ovale wallikeri TaxID=864142 RepID=A0A1A8Z0J2_PLAOA|nr:hypothetical protein POVWA2_033490 [Plasmodium ovale wallikeri]
MGRNRKLESSLQNVSHPLHKCVPSGQCQNGEHNLSTLQKSGQIENCRNVEKGTGQGVAKTAKGRGKILGKIILGGDKYGYAFTYGNRVMNNLAENCSFFTLIQKDARENKQHGHHSFPTEKKIV